MPTYNWKGIDRTGKKQHGTLLSDTTTQLKEKLLKSGIALQSCKEINAKSRRTKKTVSASFFDDLSRTLNSGIPLIQALKIMQEYTSLKTTKKITSNLIKHLQQGHPLSQAMEEEGFLTLITKTIQAGETSGQVSTVLAYLADYLSQKEEFVQKLKTAALLPVTTLLFAIGIICAVVLLIVPQLEPFLVIHGSGLNPSAAGFNPTGGSTSIPPTDGFNPFIFKISRIFSTEHYKIYVIIFLILLLSIMQILKRCPLTKQKEKISLHVPILNKIIIRINLIHFTKTLAMLLKTGTSLKESLLISSEVCTNHHISHQIKLSAMHLEKGKSLKDSLEVSGIFPSFLLSSIALGEQTGNLELMLDKAGTLLEKRLMRQISVITTLFQPLLLIGVGILIAFILLSLYTPLLNIPYNNFG